MLSSTSIIASFLAATAAGFVIPTTNTSSAVPTPLSHGPHGPHGPGHHSDTEEHGCFFAGSCCEKGSQPAVVIKPAEGHAAVVVGNYSETTNVNVK
ncbi:Uu.00g033660.m01.CDS01 [Anthostomella pinea]|uniref:Uu.00g033660.m01.CDS01 n=1 Tax=Anthostomella pinea TaxID=933095 RepID=A0AAI8V411_9PEZI|nr:Uu.00g033660.m01.CDS01 [Anthostomella pinea]